MKDLLILAADADAEAFLRGVLARPEALGIRKLTYEILRAPMRDNGVVTNGPELVRMHKGLFSKALILFDHHGSGRERQSIENLICELQDRLDRCTWMGNSAVIVLKPELEEWLWHCGSAVAKCFGIATEDLNALIDRTSQKTGKNKSIFIQEMPKELFEHIIKNELRRTISPNDFNKIAANASLPTLRKCSSFERIAQQLIGWFPAPPPP